MLQADLWDDFAEALKRMFGERMGGWCAAAGEIVAGETDLVADRIGGQKDDPTQLFAARKRRLIASRMIASQAVCKVVISHYQCRAPLWYNHNALTDSTVGWP